MEFRILGPLQVSAGDGVLKVGGPKQRAVLAHLILRANHPVPVERLIDGLWGEEPPETAKNTLQTYVYRLRQLLGEDRIASEAGGYVLHAETEEIDAARFEAMVRAAKAELQTDPSKAAAALSEALTLWRGSPLSDLSDEPSLRGEIARLEELHLSATEHRIAAEIAMGGHSTVVSELEALTARYPLRERMWANLMLALYRSGRYAEALSTYQRAREVLSAELGAEPSAELQRLHERILRRDPSLERAEPARPAVRPSRVDMPPGTEFAGYRIERILGRGGMSVVYLAEQTALQRKVALKVLAPQLAEDERFRERFVLESRLAASIDHPNVIPIYEAGEHDGELFIAMRYVEGTDLRTVLRDGPLDAARTIAIVRQVAEALDVAHEQGLVHRDVKPANVLLARRRGSESGEHAYLSDFGLTKRSASDSGVTGTGQFVGTIDYAAPEQFQGDSLDARTDVYSLGCVLFECLAGHPPFRAPNDAGLMYAHLQASPPSLRTERPDLPHEFDEVIAKAMAKRPDDRQPTAGELALGVSRVFETGIQTPTGSSLTRAGRRLLVPTLVLGLVVVAATVVLVRRSGEEAPAAGGVSGSVTGGGGQALVPARAVTAVDPRSGKLSDAVGGMYVETFDDAIRPEIGAGAGGVWLIDALTVSFIDPAAASVREATGLGAVGGLGVVPVLAVGPNDVLYTDSRQTGALTGTPEGALGRYDPVSERAEVVTFPETGRATDLALGAGAIWETFGAGILLRIDAKTLAEEHRWRLGGPLDAVAVDDGSVWVGERDTGTIWRIDPATDEVSDPIVLDGAMDGITSHGGVAWVLDMTAGTVTPVAVSFGPGQPIRLSQDLTDIESGLGAVWVSDRGGSIWRVDPDTRKTKAIDLGYPVEALTFEPDLKTVWVLVIECPAAGIPASETEGGLGCSKAFTG